jgi:hypothetical protein
VEKIFLIAFGAGELAGADGLKFELGGPQSAANFFDGFFVEGGVDDNSAFFYVGAGEFELGFYEDQEIGVWFEEICYGLEDFCG